MKGDFSLAVHLLVYLNHKKATVSSEALAENSCTNAARVRKTMAQLKRAGLIETKEGRQGGGYLFSLDAEALTLGNIARAVEADFVSSGWHSGGRDMECLIASGMADIMDGIYSGLNTLCYESLEKTTVADIDKRIFGQK